MQQLLLPALGLALVAKSVAAKCRTGSIAAKGICVSWAATVVQIYDTNTACTYMLHLGLITNLCHHCINYASQVFDSRARGTKHYCAAGY